MTSDVMLAIKTIIIVSPNWQIVSPNWRKVLKLFRQTEVMAQVAIDSASLACVMMWALLLAQASGRKDMGVSMSHTKGRSDVERVKWPNLEAIVPDVEPRFIEGDALYIVVETVEYIKYSNREEKIRSCATLNLGRD